MLRLFSLLRPRSGAVFAVALVLVSSILLAEEVSDEKVSEELPREFSLWLEEVAPLLFEDEREYFLSLSEDFRRRAFIERFWLVRDPDPATARHELRRDWEERVAKAMSLFGRLDDERSIAYLFNGEPGPFRLVDGRIVDRCVDPRRALEVWFYNLSLRHDRPFQLIFFQRRDRVHEPYRLWTGDEELAPGRLMKLPSTDPSDFCAEELLPAVLRRINEDIDGYRRLVEKVMSAPRPSSSEWVATFAAERATAPADAERMPLRVEVDFPGRNQSRTAVRGIVWLPAGELEVLPVAGDERFQLFLTAEVVRDGRLLEAFRYGFEASLPEEEGTEVPLLFQRYLRPGDARLLLKVEDLTSRRVATWEQRFAVPSATELASLRPAAGGDLFRTFEEAQLAAELGQTTLRILPPRPGEILTGKTRIQTVATGGVDEVEFFVSDRPVARKRSPPFSIEIDLGPRARIQPIAVVGYDAEGVEVAKDELLVNPSLNEFRVRFSEPRSNRVYEESLSAVVLVEKPETAVLDRVELFLDDRPVATLYQEPFVQPIVLERPGLALLRAVAYLDDGHSTEEVVIVNPPEYLERIEVQYVELLASAVDGSGDPVLGLGREDFSVREDGEPQEIRRFEFVEDLPLQLVLLLDTSASMEDDLASIASAAEGFARSAVTAKDRISLLPFDVRASTAVEFTSEVDEIAFALTGLRAEGGTALFDSLVFALHTFGARRGRKALLLLSDGADESSRFDFESALEVAQRAGVPIYAIGIREAQKYASRRNLKRLAAETGGRAFFIDRLDDLAAVYRTIEHELRSQYLLTYQSTNDRPPSEFREIKVTSGKAAEVRTLSGYYP